MAPTLFTPLTVGSLPLSHRVIMAPLTRFRASDAHVHGDLAVEYYSQRASCWNSALCYSLMLQPYAARFPGLVGGLPNAV